MTSTALFIAKIWKLIILQQ